jgi:hypothetical protein
MGRWDPDGMASGGLEWSPRLLPAELDQLFVLSSMTCCNLLDYQGMALPAEIPSESGAETAAHRNCVNPPPPAAPPRHPREGRANHLSRPLCPHRGLPHDLQDRTLGGCLLLPQGEDQ